MYEIEKIHEEHELIEEIQTQNEPKPTMPALFITAETVKKKITQYGNFKSPGIDGIPNFWLKKLNSLQEDFLAWLTHGSTSLLPKSQETKKPTNIDQYAALTQPISSLKAL